MTVLAVLLVVAAPAVAPGPALEPVPTGAEAAAMIRRVGGRLEYNELYWEHVAANLSKTKVTDADLRYLRGLEDLQFVILSETGVTDEGMRHVGRLKGVQFLFLDGTSVTDKGLEHLAGMRA